MSMEAKELRKGETGAKAVKKGRTRMASGRMGYRS
jgi:hypothetical protein